MAADQEDHMPLEADMMEEAFLLEGRQDTTFFILIDDKRFLYWLIERTLNVDKNRQPLPRRLKLK
jgi:hypothetical protein